LKKVERNEKSEVKVRNPFLAYQPTEEDKVKVKERGISEFYTLAME
jgi:hypothetical protein